MSRSGASVALGNLAGTGGGGVELSDATPQAPGSPAPGVGTKASRDDHVHAPPSAGQIGALSASSNLSDLDDAAEARGNLWLGSAATANTTDFDAAGAAAAAQAASQPLDADLTAIAALTSAADRVPYATGAGTWSLATFTAAGRALVDDADAAAQRVTLGLGDAATKNTGTTAGTVAAGDDARFPTADEKAALAGTGTPSASNKFVTDDDSRLSGSFATTMTVASYGGF